MKPQQITLYTLPIALLLLTFFSSSPLFAEPHQEFATLEEEENTHVELDLPDRSQDFSRSAVTYALDCGRLGDQLINYIKALWVSYQYDLTLFYKPFPFSDKFRFSEVHPHLNDHKKQFKPIPIKQRDELERALLAEKKRSRFKNTRNLYEISFYSHFSKGWEDEEFRNSLKELIAPISPLNLLDVPKDCITIAVHVRTGAGYDSKRNIDKMPEKFPSYSFYAHGLKQIANYYEGQPLYIYVFTDFPEPTEIRDLFLKTLNSWNVSNPITMECRESKNDYKTNVLEDFFSLTLFDCLVRAGSSYSGAAGAISGPIIEISPSKKQEGRNKKIPRDSQGKAILDNLIQIRTKKGGVICEQFITPVEPICLD